MERKFDVWGEHTTGTDTNRATRRGVKLLRADDVAAAGGRHLFETARYGERSRHCVFEGHHGGCIPGMGADDGGAAFAAPRKAAVLA